ncbi:MAG: hypothetical protein L3J36_01820 [Rhodobacteraceae bacterium]|nr:hypothetical protein [Paracoccaceae bacterium]
MIRLMIILPLILAGCAGQGAGQGTGQVTRFAPDYMGVQTALLDGDLVQFQVRMTGARSKSDLDAYAECAAAQYALIRGYGFARHLRTNIDQTDGLWSADAVYTISSSLPQGLRTIDAEVVVANCAENEIPTV